MASLNIQSEHINRLLCAFLRAATPGNIVKSLENAGICVVPEVLESGSRRLLCQVRPEKARCLLFPIEEILPRPIPEVYDDEEENRGLEEQLYLEACADLIYDIGPENPEAETA